MLTADIIRQLTPGAKPHIVEGVVKYFNQYADKYNVDTWMRVCHFLAQAAHESAHFTTLEEFASGAAYEGRKDLGNTQPGDGKRYKGRGIFQLTGRANYRQMGAKLGLDLEGNPELAEQPEVSVLTALEYWNSRNISVPADNDDVVAVTKKINGGTNGLDDRKKYLQKIKNILPKNISFIRSEPTSDTIVEELRPAKRGDRGSNVRKIQEKLNNRGSNLVIDGIYGRATELAVKEFQKKNALFMSGNVDAKTLNALTG